MNTRFFTVAVLPHRNSTSSATRWLWRRSTPSDRTAARRRPSFPTQHSDTQSASCRPESDLWECVYLYVWRHTSCTEEKKQGDTLCCLLQQTENFTRLYKEKMMLKKVNQMFKRSASFPPSFVCPLCRAVMWLLYSIFLFRSILCLECRLPLAAGCTLEDFRGNSNQKTSLSHVSVKRISRRWGKSTF